MNTATSHDVTLQRAQRSMRPLSIAAAILASVLAALSVAVLASPASAAPGALAGTWSSVDLDGSNQTLTIVGAGHPVYSTVYRDEFTSGVCGGPPAKLVGRGTADDSEITVVGTLICLNRGNPLPGEHITLHFEYSAVGDTLTDDAGGVWHRTG